MAGCNTRLKASNPLCDGSVPCSAVSVPIYHDTDRLPRNVLFTWPSGAFPLCQGAVPYVPEYQSVAFQSSFSACIFQLLLLNELMSFEKRHGYRLA